jgi:hypothetical protein
LDFLVLKILPILSAVFQVDLLVREVQLQVLPWKLHRQRLHSHY